MKEYIGTIVIGIITLLIGAFIGYYVDIIKTQNQNKTRYIDVKIDNERGVLQAPDIVDDVEIIWNKTDIIKAISSITVRLYNFTDKDFEKVPVYIELIPTDDQEIKIIASNTVGENDLPDSINALKNIGKPSSEKIIKYGYEIDTLNRSDDLQYIFKATYLIKGNTLPNANVYIKKKGLKEQVFSIKHYQSDPTIKEVLLKALVVILLIGITVGYIYLLRWMLKIGQKRKIKLANEHALYIKSLIEDDNDNFTVNTNLSTDEVAKQITYELRMIGWNKLSKTDKWLMKSSMPKIDDVKFEK